jgi:bifunctional NMN adenylyltransferase/nudix hydrolase
MQMTKVAVFIGRFQPFHNGHKHVIDTAFKTCNDVIVIVGSSNEPRTARNPFTFEERKAMIVNSFFKESIPNMGGKSISVCPSVNRFYNDTAWANDIRETVSKLTKKGDEIYLIGYKKDHTSFYLNMFPEWKSIDVYPATDGRMLNPKILNATDIREQFYKNYHNSFNALTDVPSCVKDVVNGIPMAEIDNVIAEHKHIQDYKKQWANAPYPPTFVTVDAVVTQAGHILMVRRGAQPGKGLLALPGGFINQYEGIKDACVRELIEETKIDLPKAAIYGSIVDSHVFDSPYRSQRGRTITHAFHLELDSKRPLPKVKGSDDAEKAFWIPLNALMRDKVFEDHSDIISFFTGVHID